MAPIARRPCIHTEDGYTWQTPQCDQITTVAEAQEKCETPQHLLTLLQGLSGAYTENKGVNWKVLFRVGRRQGEKARRERDRKKPRKEGCKQQK